MATASERKRAYDAEFAKKASLVARDIGPIPPIANLGRRQKCRDSLRLFCEVYNSDTFSLPWSADQLRAIARIEEAVTRGALYAFAEPRGNGKTSRVRMAALWAIAYAHCRYVFVVGANAAKAEDSLGAIRTWIRFLPEFGEDFPEIAFPARALGGIAHRASGQICQGEPTLIEWSKDRIILPTVSPPPNWPKHWRLRADGKAPSSGSVVSVSGLTGDGIRGSLLTLSTGESVRPDLVLLDDPQTRESACSPTQNETREQLVSADVLGMAGPGKTISAIMPCTVIAPGDFIDRILDRSKHPLWRGERTRLLQSMPVNLGAWDRYFDIYRDCAQREPPDFTEANTYYLEHREALDAGAVASWPARKLPGEVSAIQHAMHLYCRDPRAFAAEYQNEPLVDQATDNELTADQIASLTNGLPRGVVPQWATRLTAFVDVQKDLLFWLVCAWSDHFTGHVLDYGTYPDQQRAYFALRDARPTLADATGVPGIEAQIFKGLACLVETLISRQFQREDGEILRIEKLLIDANWQTEVVKQWIRQSGRAPVVLPAHGRFFGATAAPITDYKIKVGERKGLHWIVSKHVLYDTNWWKSFVAARFATPQPSKGCLTLWGDRPHPHRLIAEHLTSERRERVEARGRTLDVWDLVPGRENHWLDCLVGATVAASVQGSALANVGAEPAKTRQRVSFSEQQRKAREKRAHGDD